MFTRRVVERPSAGQESVSYRRDVTTWHGAGNANAGLSAARNPERFGREYHYDARGRTWKEVNGLCVNLTAAEAVRSEYVTAIEIVPVVVVAKKLAIGVQL